MKLCNETVPRSWGIIQKSLMDFLRKKFVTPGVDLLVGPLIRQETKEHSGWPQDPAAERGNLFMTMPLTHTSQVCHRKVNKPCGSIPIQASVP